MRYYLIRHFASTAANLREKGEDLIHKVNIEKDFTISFDRGQNETSVR